MLLAVNDSSILQSLLREYPSLPVDLIKVPTVPFPDCWGQFTTDVSPRRLLPHVAQTGVLALGHPQAELRFNPETIQRVLEITNPIYLSTHLECRVQYFPDLSVYQHQNHPMVRKKLKSHLLSVLPMIQNNIKVPLVLENFPYYTWWCHFREGSEPEFISEVCEEAGCGFLLDISHARCSAWHMERDLMEYINALPLHKLVEIHLAGAEQRGSEGLRDTHTLPSADDYQLLEYLLARRNPEIVTIEYGGLPDRIMSIQQIYEPISRNNPAELLDIIYQVKGLMDRKCLTKK